MITYEIIYRYADGTLAKASVRTACTQGFYYTVRAVQVPCAQVWSLVALSK